MDLENVRLAKHELEQKISKLVCEFNGLTDCHVVSVEVGNYEAGTIISVGAKSKQYETYIVKMDIDSGI